ncbi:MAG: BlaI/MecI/CopY family transcriptional regulator [Planctomycetota bacterium]
MKAEAESFVRRIGGGSIEPMLAAFVEDKQLSAEKIARLKDILSQAEAAGDDEQ